MVKRLFIIDYETDVKSGEIYRFHGISENLTYILTLGKFILISEAMDIRTLGGIG